MTDRELGAVVDWSAAQSGEVQSVVLGLVRAVKTLRHSLEKCQSERRQEAVLALIEIARLREAA